MEKQRTLRVMVVIAIVLVISGRPVLAKRPIKWKAQSAWPSGLLGQKAFEDFCQKVKVMSDGRLIIKPYLSIISDLTAAWNNPHEAYTFHYYQGGLDMLNKLYEPFGVYALGVVIVGMESFSSKIPLRTVEDFKGIKIRSPEGMLGDLLRKMGASVVVLPSPEAYSALDKGVVDATDYSAPSANFRLGLHQVAKYFNYPGFHSMPQSDFTVNKRAWDKLPDDLKEIVRIAQREWCEDLIQRGFIEDLEAVDKMKAAGCVQIKWSDEELAKVRKLAEQVWDEWARKSPRCKEAVELQKQWLRRLGSL
ncbi:MAG: TRAP transporter substrate-binding protein DctP [Deltaproteobacteria bacterium]|nr:TRAP transporter substrate-binding protein DctP [Deltaproteobacteria bacterium]